MFNDLEKAIYFATIAHQNQKRIKEDIDFIIHPFTVGMMLKDLGLANEYVISGILHDVIEDTSFSYQDIEKEFGKKVATNVLKVSENKNISDWKERKKEFIARLKKEKDDNILILECADKLHNLLSDYNLFKKIGKEIWKYSSVSYEDIKWYYKNIFKIIKERCNNDLIIRYQNILNHYFND